MSEHEKRIREALEAGPTPGPWNAHVSDPGTFQVATVERFGIYSSHPEYGGNVGVPDADAVYVAACSPGNLQALLDDLDRLRSEREVQDAAIANLRDAELDRLRDNLKLQVEANTFLLVEREIRRAELEAAREDSDRINWLEAQINGQGEIHLHDGEHPRGPGLGLRPGLIGRTLRGAIDAARGAK
jgi:hypothetical protein